MIRAESPLAIDGVGAFELLWEYEVGALVGLRGPIIGRGNVELGDLFHLPRFTALSNFSSPHLLSTSAL